MRLFIAEKPQLAKVIAEALGNAKWRKADLPLKLRPAKYQPIERTAAQFAVVLMKPLPTPSKTPALASQPA